MRDRKKKNIIIGSLCCLLVFMGIGYATLSQKLTIKGTAKMQGTWDIKISSMKLVEEKRTGMAKDISHSYTKTTAIFESKLYAPGDSIEYEVTVENQGNIDAVLKDIIQIKTNKDKNLKFSNSLIGTEVLTSGSKMSFTMKVEIPEYVEIVPETKVSTYEIQLIYIQYNGGEYTPPTQSIGTLADKILADNTALPDTNIDFSKISSDTNGKGLYYTNKNTEDNKTTYYFRGGVKNNYVKFANFTWRIIRINEDGSVRLIKQDLLDDSAFNSRNDNPMYIGYMYGASDGTTYEELHKNSNSSVIKMFVDEWYKNNLIDYQQYFSDSGFCGDRSISSGTGIDLTKETKYGAYNRIITIKKPQFACPKSNDLYTTIDASKGNKSLTYPIGLLTADEAVYAGAIYGSVNNNIYLLTSGKNFWMMSPSYSASAEVVNMLFLYDGRISGAYLKAKFAIRPVINLKFDVEIISGDGTINNPYVVK